MPFKQKKIKNAHFLSIFNLLEPKGIYGVLNHMFRIIAAIISLHLMGCTKQEVGDHQLEYFMDFTITAGSNPLKTHVFEKTIESNWSSFLKANQIHDSMILKINVYSIEINPILSNPISYGFVEEARAFIIDTRLPSTQQIGIYNPVPNERVGTLGLLPGIADLKSFLSLNQFNIQIQLRFRNIPSSTTDHRVIVKFNIYLK